jgi:2-dehydropantoate 2-reductase
MRIQIMGAGALGCLFGALIQQAGYEVIYVARGKQYEALKKGLKVSGLMEAEFLVKTSSKPIDADVTFVTVKAYDTENAAKALAEIDPGIVCSLQNGVGNEEILMQHLNRVIGGTTTYGANMLEPGHIIFAGKGITYIGEIDGGISEDVRIVEEVLKNSYIEVEVVEDIRRRIWVKAAINACINPITALTRVRNGKIAEVKELWDIAEKIAEECEAVLNALGFETGNLKEVVREVVIKTANNRSSMLQDIEKGKRTEIDFINGAFVAKGEEVGVDVVYNRIMWNMLKGVERAHGMV